MSRSRNAYQLAIHTLKLALKQQGLTYKDLAKRIHLSESGVKKIFSASDGSFQRIAQISGELGFSMSELLSGHSENIFDLSYSELQQEYLVNEPRALRLFWALVYERRSIAEAQALAGLSAKELFPILRRLDQLRFLELLPGDRIRVPAVRQIRWVGSGPLVRKIYQEWSAKFLSSVASPEAQPGELFLLRYFRSSRKTVEDLIAALREIEVEFVGRAIREMRTESADLVHLRWMSAVDQKSFLAD